MVIRISGLVPIKLQRADAVHHVFERSREEASRKTGRYKIFIFCELFFTGVASAFIALTKIDVVLTNNRFYKKNGVICSNVGFKEGCGLIMIKINGGNHLA